MVIHDARTGGIGDGNRWEGCLTHGHTADKLPIMLHSPLYPVARPVGPTEGYLTLYLSLTTFFGATKQMTNRAEVAKVRHIYYWSPVVIPLAVLSWIRHIRHVSTLDQSSYSPFRGFSASIHVHCVAWALVLAPLRTRFATYVRCDVATAYPCVCNQRVASHLFSVPRN